jgi:hypothetical protein
MIFKGNRKLTEKITKKTTVYRKLLKKQTLNSEEMNIDSAIKTKKQRKFFLKTRVFLEEKNKKKEIKLIKCDSLN